MRMHRCHNSGMQPVWGAKCVKTLKNTILVYLPPTYKYNTDLAKYLPDFKIYIWVRFINVDPIYIRARYIYKHGPDLCICTRFIHVSYLYIWHRYINKGQIYKYKDFT